ncbi:DUF2798 domain-containing protein [Providencia sp.]
MSCQNRNSILGIPKLPARAMIFLVPFFLSLVMSGIVSLISTIRALGFTSEVFSPWVSSWMLSWAIAFPTVFFVLPIARRISLMLVKQSTMEINK